MGLSKTARNARDAQAPSHAAEGAPPAMTRVRPPAVAGLFYPDDPTLLARAVARYLADAETDDGRMGSAAEGGAIPQAVIAPHAGYVYSGPIAAHAYAPLRPLKGKIERAVIVGPTHRVAIRGLALPTVDAFATPLGAVPIDAAARARVASLPQIMLADEPHRLEHALETQLPFLLAVLGPVPILPMVAGEATGAEVARAIETASDGDASRTLVVISSDLSHYHDYRTAQRMDRATSDAIEALDARAIGWDQACGRVPIAGMIEIARARGLRAKTRDLRNSGDTAGDRSRVVGYGAYVFA